MTNREQVEEEEEKERHSEQTSQVKIESSSVIVKMREQKMM